MSRFKSYFLKLVFTLLGSAGMVLTAIAHSEGESWGPHMAGARWGFGPMILFWVVGVLLIILLSVTLLRTLQDR